MKRIAVITLLALYSMGGCDHESGCGNEHHSQTQPKPNNTQPVVPAPAAVVLAGFGVLMVLTRKRHDR